jgi:hypothetical protein
VSKLQQKSTSDFDHQKIFIRFIIEKASVLIVNKKRNLKMMEDTGEPVLRQGRRDFDSYFKRFVEKPFQVQLDRWTPHTLKRWAVTVVLTVLFDLRIFMLQGYYIPCYALKIYHLNLFLAFLTPKIDPAILAAAEDNGDGSNEVYILGNILSGTSDAGTGGPGGGALIFCRLANPCCC